MAYTDANKVTNLEKLNEMVRDSNLPFIVYDVETTGVMNGNDNRITQVALAFYDFNKDTNQYELKDSIFMLAKPDENVLHQISLNELPTKENVERKLRQEFFYLKTKKLDKNEKSKYLEQTKDVSVLSDEFTNKGLEQVRKELVTYTAENFDRMKNEIENTPKLKDVLAKQGLTLDTYIREGKGLTPTEMQVGISAFLDKYVTKATAFINNGTYYSKHYMEKENLSLNNSADVTIDLTQAERSRHGGKSEWTSDITVFAQNYKRETGKEIKVFDALTKTLCMGEMTAKACGKNISHTSEELLQNKVKESALSKDNEYVMSLSRANTLKWIPTSKENFDYADYHFNNLEYVDFGNDRRYVDIDKMFEVNDNFEITLEGDKTPIKTWEELENKIKSLNAKISDKLLEQIHEKYEEIKDKVDKEFKDKQFDVIVEKLQKGEFIAHWFDGESELELDPTELLFHKDKYCRYEQGAYLWDIEVDFEVSSLYINCAYENGTFTTYDSNGDNYLSLTDDERAKLDDALSYFCEHTREPMAKEPIAETDSSKFPSSFDNLMAQIEDKKRQINEMQKIEQENIEEISHTIDVLDKEMNRKFEQFENAYCEILQKYPSLLEHNNLAFVIKNEPYFVSVERWGSADNNSVSWHLYTSKGNKNDNITLKGTNLLSDGFAENFFNLSEDVQNVIRETFLKDCLYGKDEQNSFESIFNTVLLKEVDKALKSQKYQYERTQKSLDDFLSMTENDDKEYEEDERDI